MNVGVSLAPLSDHVNSITRYHPRVIGSHMTQPEVREVEQERGKPWALLGLLLAVSVAVFIMALGFSAG